MNDLTDEQKALQEEAKLFAKRNKQRIAKEFTCKEKFPPETGEGETPTSWFMAGAPGAGKTETSVELLRIFEENGGHSALRIDPDELRKLFEKYDGENSWIFQPAVSILVERIVDLALQNSQSFILDGTFSSIKKAKTNISRCLKRKRDVLVIYIYQDPLLAWQFAQAREKTEGRRVPMDSFISQYFESRNVVNEVIQEFSSSINIMLIAKDKDCNIRLVAEVLESIDSHIPETYDPQTLRNALELSPEH